MILMNSWIIDYCYMFFFQHAALVITYVSVMQELCASTVLAL